MKQIKKFENYTNSDDTFNERREIVQRIIDGLVKDQNNHPGYKSFKEELEDFLNSFPKE